MDRTGIANELREDDRIPVHVAISDILSGVDSWAKRLERVFRDHPRYRIDLIALNARSRRDPRFADWATWEWQLERILRRRAARPGIVVANYLWQFLSAAAERIERGQRLACIGFCHSDSEKEYYEPLAWYEPILSRFVAVSETCAARLRETLPERREDVRMATYGIELAPQPAVRPQAGPLRLVYAGRMVQEQKCVFDFAELMRCLAAEAVDARLSLVGTGDDEQELRRRLAPFADRVDFLGARKSDEMPAVFADHDVFVQVSAFEGTSNSMLEAMARGTLPAVTEVASGVRGILEDGHSGVLVARGDMAGLAVRLAELARDRARLARMARASWVRAADFSIERNAQILAAIFDEALAEPQRRWPSGRRLHPPRPFHGGLIGWPRRRVKLRQFLRRLAGRA
jgi:glycosyltransferase involved in cell wall biosynthesis